MNVREAILKAADSIESRPDLFDFMTYVPEPDCGTPGCALGWIAIHAGLTRTDRRMDDGYFTWDHKGLAELLTVSTWDFYERMTAASGSHEWKGGALQCASALRLYADKYHPAPKSEHVGIPATVRAIFESEQVSV